MKPYCLPPQVKSPSIAIYSHYTLHLLPLSSPFTITILCSCPWDFFFSIPSPEPALDFLKIILEYLCFALTGTQKIWGFGTIFLDSVLLSRSWEDVSVYWCFISKRELGYAWVKILCVDYFPPESAIFHEFYFRSF